MSAGTIAAVAAEAAAVPLDLLLTGAALGALAGRTRAAPGCGLRLAAVLVARTPLVAGGRGTCSASWR